MSTVHDIFRETGDVIWDVLSPMELAQPKARDWKRIADGFYSSWNFPNCLGALDGKHVVMHAPPKSGSFNYEGTFSIVLMALVDDDYRFTYVDIEDYGSNSDGVVFKNCASVKAFMNNELDVPPPKLSCQ